MTAQFGDAAAGPGLAVDVVGGFLAMAGCEPAAPAVIHGDLTTSYASLADRVLSIADRMSGQIGPETVVAVEMERSLDCLAAFLAVMHAGGAAALVDPALPAARRDLIVAGAGAVVRLTAESIASSPARATPSGAAPVGAASVRATHADLIAYVCHTSGSTGRPNAVAVTHRALANRLAWGQSEYPLDDGDRVLWHASIGFDFSVWEMLAPLLAGACVVVGDGQTPFDPRRTADQLVRHGVTAVHFVPSVLRAHLKTADPASLARLRYLFLGGEPLDARLLLQVQRLTSARVLNQYGPTETCIDSTWFDCTGLQVDEPGDGSVPIGAPIDGTQLLLLSRDGGLADEPEAELGIVGAGLARGYLGDPRRTAERFVPSPIGPPGARVYLTGDVVARRADGMLDFRGRRDGQVKINGIRVELEEVRRAVCSVAPEADVAVASPVVDGSPRLVAFVATEPGIDGVQQLAPDLAAILPAAMIPRVVRVPTLPRLPSGKVDVQALLGTDVVATRPDATAVPALTPLEGRLAEIWASVLDAPSVATIDNFFELGGHSLMATEVVARIEEVFSVELPLGEFFDADTLGDLAAAIAALSTVTEPGSSRGPAREETW